MDFVLGTWNIRMLWKPGAESSLMNTLRWAGHIVCVKNEKLPK